MSILVLDNALTLSEAADIWNIDPSIIHYAINDNRFNQNEIAEVVNTWLVSYEAMLRVFEEPSNNTVIMTNLYTIGYEGRNIDQFLSVLKENQINVIIDVRANPISRKKGFSKNSLSENLEQNGIIYKPYATLGTPKELRNELRESGDYFTFFERYENWLSKQIFKLQGLQLEVVCHPSKRYCLMCFEKNPNECHRSVIARNLHNKTNEIADIINL